MFFFTRGSFKGMLQIEVIAVLTLDETHTL